jgi:hypothetical protein
LRPLPEALAVGRRGVAEVTRTLWTDALEAFTARAVRDHLLAEMPPPGQLTASPPATFATTLDLYADALLRVLEHAGRAAADSSGPAATRLAEHLVIVNRRLAGNAPAAEAAPPAREAVQHHREVYQPTGRPWTSAAVRQAVALAAEAAAHCRGPAHCQGTAAANPASA